MTGKSLELLRQGAAELGVPLTEQHIASFARVGNELKKWGSKINLTAILDDEGIVIKHFLDSLSVLPLLPEQGTLLDIGSGAGFPSIPVKIMRPQLEVTSVDAVEKKIFFQRQVGRLLGLTEFSPLHARVESLQKKPQRYGIITSRAFSDLSLFVRLALPLLDDEGTIIAMKGDKGDDEAVLLESAGLAVRIVETRHFRLPFDAGARSFIVLKKS